MKKILASAKNIITRRVMRFVGMQPASYTLLTTLLVTNDYPPKTVDTLFFFGRAKGDDNDAIFKLAADTYRSGTTRNILINGSDGEREGGTVPGECWAGKTEWTNRLEKLGVKKERIHHFEPAYFTADEAGKMLRYAEEQGWKSAAILAQPHQLLRCMAALICIMNKTGFKMKIYCLAPKSCDWFTDTAGSQGLQVMPRWQHVALEYTRIQRYLYGLATPKEVFHYYQTRETIS